MIESFAKFATSEHSDKPEIYSLAKICAIQYAIVYLFLLIRH